MKFGSREDHSTNPFTGYECQAIQYEGGEIAVNQASEDRSVSSAEDRQITYRQGGGGQGEGQGGETNPRNRKNN